MTIAYVRHRVADYDAWRKGYEQARTLQRQGGVVEEAVYRDDATDETWVLVMHRFQDSDRAHAFFAQPELRDAMSAAGVDAGSVRVEYYEEA
jgi:hypothetical protein